MILTSRDVRSSSAVLTLAGIVAILVGLLGLQAAEKMKRGRIRQELNDSLDEAIKDSAGFGH